MGGHGRAGIQDNEFPPPSAPCSRFEFLHDPSGRGLELALSGLCDLLRVRTGRERVPL